LKGAGTTLALPLLDAMVPALAAQSLKPVPRLGFIYFANGVIQNQWTPAETGRAWQLTPTLSPLDGIKDYLNVYSGLAHLQADTFGDGTGDHPRSSAAWLTGIHAYDRTQPGVEVRLTITADQIAARVIGKTTQLPSLELTVDFPTQGSCDSGDCFYVNTISWRNETTPNPAETHPRIVFERLFGDGGSAAQRMARVKSTGSILDSILDEVNSLGKTLGKGDRTKLNEYTDAVREIEQRIQNTESQGSHNISLIDRPVDVPESFDDYTKMMLDLVALAYQADITRVFTMIFARELSTRSFAHIGVPDQHHPVSHHRNDPDMIVKKAKIDTYHVQLLNHFLTRLKATPEGEGTLLDNSLTLYGGGMGDGNLHRHFDLPCLTAGKLGGQLKTGSHYAYRDNMPMTNLLLTILDKAGAPIDKLGDSTGALAL
ncbi:MAG TPA: DUF1552 domain-containing protein, partial [Terriglobia bacterium]|nr:DUF1552 domain-containing protein [Terriglobia bacterium]